MNLGLPISAGAGVALLVGLAIFVNAEVSSAKDRLEHPPTKAPEQSAAVADHTEAAYCTPQFKQVLSRVLKSCGLVGDDSRRGCQPADVKSLVRDAAVMNDEDFNALFTPLTDRGAIILFDDASEKLDDGAKKVILDKWQDRRGARYFFVVARASKKGTPEGNRAWSNKRANSVYLLIQDETKDADLEKQIGKLWLGSEFAQLPKDYCDKWSNSRPGKPCDAEAINRSAFVSWVDCRL
jgi:outer membrane protein OmpA-like peptidoglycan-associated protein